MWIIFKVLYWICYKVASVLCFGLFFWPWSIWDLSSPVRDQTHTSCIGWQNLNHWTTKEVPQVQFLSDSAIYSLNDIGQVTILQTSISLPLVWEEYCLPQGILVKIKGNKMWWVFLVAFYRLQYRCEERLTSSSGHPHPPPPSSWHPYSTLLL